MKQVGDSRVVVITDRGGHLHDAMRLLDQMQIAPRALITTLGPDVDYLKTQFEETEIICFPLQFSWWGKKRFWNPYLLVVQVILAFKEALRIRPTYVISTGASDVVPFCYFTKLFGGKVIHIENLAQVVNPSVTGRLLYPIADHFFVQWEDLLKAYGPKAQYKGWVL